MSDWPRAAYCGDRRCGWDTGERVGLLDRDAEPIELVVAVDGARVAAFTPSKYPNIIASVTYLTEPFRDPAYPWLAVRRHCRKPTEAGLWKGDLQCPISTTCHSLLRAACRPGSPIPRASRPSRCASG